MLRVVTDKHDDRSRGLMGRFTRKRRNIAAVAEANKAARITRAVLARNAC